MTPEEGKAKFKAFDFEADPRWRDYKQKVELGAGIDQDAAWYRIKQKWYRTNIDAEYEIQSRASLRPEPSSTSGAAPRTGFMRRSEAEASSSSGPARPTGSARPPPPPPAGQARGAAPHFDVQTTTFVAELWVIVMAAIYSFPFTPMAWAVRPYRFCFLGYLIVNLLVVHRQHGWPRALRLAALQDWIARNSRSIELLNLLYATLFLAGPVPVKMSCLPPAAYCIIPVAKHLKAHFSQTEIYRRYLLKGCEWVEANSEQVKFLGAHMEVGIGLILAFNLLTPLRNIIQLFVYWNILKFWYHHPVTQTYHHQTWRAINQKVAPVRNALPMLNVPLGYAQRWFETIN